MNYIGENTAINCNWETILRSVIIIGLLESGLLWLINFVVLTLKEVKNPLGLSLRPTTAKYR
jgi:hypothetical protein